MDEPHAKPDDRPELLELVEALARQGHDAWMAKRLSEGWKLGPVQDGARKVTPLLVPYDELSESEKDTDRAVVWSTIHGMDALRWKIEPPGPKSSSPSQNGDRLDLETWIKHLEDERESFQNRGPRARNFDMDDGPELALPALRRFPVLQRALTFLSQTVTPAWSEMDGKALELQRCQQVTARMAIAPGTIAILASIFQLVLERGEHGPGPWVNGLMWLELVAAVTAGIAVTVGFGRAFHHQWLAHRNAAERLRSLKFAALGRPELWTDPPAWEAAVRGEVEMLRKLEFGDTKEWVEEAMTKVPMIPQAPSGVSSAEGEALAVFHRVKRLEYQKHYFETQSEEAERKAWFVRLRFPVAIFIASVLAVIAHVILWLVAHGDPRFESLGYWLIGIAAALPVFGLGLRASLAAFEVPRSRNLFRAKARALKDYISRNVAGAGNPQSTLAHIALTEHFFTAEHLEWCRLHVEAEWFV